MKILCAGDIHIGRRPSRLPAEVDRGQLSCASAWSAMVERAIGEGVDLLALSGDLVDESNKYYEAIGPLEAGVRKLAEHGIRTVAVAGNHDHDVLAWLADGLAGSDFVLLGRGGRWERHTVERDGQPALHIDGWSFPDRTHRDDPLRGYALPDGGGVPVLGLLHCDLGQPTSPYAPVQITDLRRRPVGFWLLGHVHAGRPMEEPGTATVLYPGSPQPMDPGEPGVHGAWLVEIDRAGRFTARQLPLATVRYERVDVEVTGAEDEGALRRRITDVVRQTLRDCVDEGCGPLRHLSLRLRLTGRTSMHREMDGVLADLAAFESTYQGVAACVEQTTVATRPARDLAALAGSQDAPGELARLVLALERGVLEADHERLVQAAARAATGIRDAKPYRSLHDAADPVMPDEARRMLVEPALRLLDELLAQKEAV